MKFRTSACRLVKSGLFRILRVLHRIRGIASGLRSGHRLKVLGPGRHIHLRDRHIEGSYILDKRLMVAMRMKNHKLSSLLGCLKLVDTRHPVCLKCDYLVAGVRKSFFREKESARDVHGFLLGSVKSCIALTRRGLTMRLLATFLAFLIA
jgi:hypothetical protein